MTKLDDVRQIARHKRELNFFTRPFWRPQWRKEMIRQTRQKGLMPGF
jgi:hypothetical protein